MGVDQRRKRLRRGRGFSSGAHPPTICAHARVRATTLLTESSRIRTGPPLHQNIRPIPSANKRFPAAEPHRHPLRQTAAKAADGPPEEPSVVALPFSRIAAPRVSDASTVLRNPGRRPPVALASIRRRPINARIAGGGRNQGDRSAGAHDPPGDRHSTTSRIWDDGLREVTNVPQKRDFCPCHGQVPWEWRNG